MAAFATFAAAEARARAKSSGFGDGTWVNAHAEKSITGTIGVRVLRRQPPNTNGGWVSITDDGTV